LISIVASAVLNSYALAIVRLDTRKLDDGTVEAMQIIV
jgi:hypothetical protein